jgi:phosphonate transport system substrate-binding protein
MVRHGFHRPILEFSIERLAHCIAVFIATALCLLSTASAWAADWRQDIGTFRVGMVASGAPTAAGVEALRRSYSAALGMPVDFFIASDLAQLIDAQATSRVEYALYSATAYATAAELCQCVEPIVAPKDVDGALGIRSILLARKGKVSSLADLPKAKLVVPANDDVSGWLAPLSLLAREGLALRGDESNITIAPSVLDAEAIFAGGGAGAMLGWERVASSGEALLQGGTIDRLRRAGVDIGGLQRVWISPIIPYGPHVVLKDLDPEAKTILSGYLTGLHTADPQAYDLLSGGHSGGFVAVEDSNYTIVREIVRTITTSDP